MVGVIVCFNLACESTDPGTDIRRTRTWMQERTGAAEVYDPQADHLVGERVEALLANGVSVDEAVSIALLNNRSLQAMFEQIGVSRADLVQSQLISNPTVSLGLFFPEGGGRAKLDMGFAQQIVDLWRIPVRKRIAEIQLEQTVRQVAQQAVDLAADVHRACYDLIALQDIAKIVRENRQLAGESVILVQQRFANGQSSLLEVNLAKEEALQAQADEIGVQRDIELSMATVRELLGLSRHDGPLVLADALPAPAALNDESVLLDRAMQQRFDSQVARYEVELAEADLKQQYVNILPSLQVGMGAERGERRAMPDQDVLANTVRESIRNGQLTRPGLDTPAQRDQQRRQEIDWTVGPTLDVELPLFDQNQAQIAKARHVLTQKRKNYEALLDAVAKQVQRSAAVLRGNQQLVQFYSQQIIPLASSNVEDARNLYQAGQSDVFSLIDSQRSLLKRRREYVGILRDYAVALAGMEQAVGGGYLHQPASAPASAGS